MGLTRWCGVSPGSPMLMTRWFIPLCTLNSKKVWSMLDVAQLEVVAAVLSGIWQARNSVVWELKLPLPRQTWNMAAHNLEAWRHLVHFYAPPPEPDLRQHLHAVPQGSDFVSLPVGLMQALRSGHAGQRSGQCFCLMRAVSFVISPLFKLSSLAFGYHGLF
ncbi:unnamed protein product [Cuscuta campestris]|uniref:Uncharacterized protein n=1 Tax=Cuscuta campestris TaxID=132261 RepID=A0A484KUW0_9ASTE|nr:unnamed protein product [Cuscuta campestris]